MPIVRIDLLEGRAPERKVDLIRRVTEAVVVALDVRPEQVRVLLNEVPGALGDRWADDRRARRPCAGSRAKA